MDDSDATLSRPLIDDQKYDSDTQSQRSIRTTLWPWLTTLAATVAALLITVVYHSHSISDHACHAGELSIPNISNLPNIYQRFTGGLKYDNDGNVYRDTSGENTSYIGNNSGVNDAWKVFEAIQTIELQPDEVDIEGLYTDHRPMVITIPDVFHQLHCLDQIRMALYSGEYLADGNAVQRVHIDHCIDYIRQVIQCRSDLTPLKLYYSQSAKRMMVDFEVEHQCKDFDAIVDWTWQHRAQKDEVE